MKCSTTVYTLFIRHKQDLSPRLSYYNVPQTFGHGSSKDKRGERWQDGWSWSTHGWAPIHGAKPGVLQPVCLFFHESQVFFQSSNAFSFKSGRVVLMTANHSVVPYSQQAATRRTSFLICAFCFAFTLSLGEQLVPGRRAHGAQPFCWQASAHLRKPRERARKRGGIQVKAARMAVTSAKVNQQNTSDTIQAVLRMAGAVETMTQRMPR